MGGPHEAGGDDRDSPLPERDLDAVRALARHLAAKRGDAGNGHGAGPHRRACPTAAERADAAKTAIRESADAHTIPGAELVDEGDQGLDARIGLGVDVDAGLGPAEQQLLNAREAGPRNRGTESCAHRLARNVAYVSADSTSTIGRAAIAPVRSVRLSRPGSWQATRKPSRSRARPSRDSDTPPPRPRRTPLPRSPALPPRRRGTRSDRRRQVADGCHADAREKPVRLHEVARSDQLDQLCGAAHRGRPSQDRGPRAWRAA